MARFKTSSVCGPIVLALSVAVLAVLAGCGGDEGPSGPVLGEEVDLALYSPLTLEGYSATYRTTMEDRVGESTTWYYGTEAVYDTDPETGEEIQVTCQVLQEDGDGILQNYDMRVYSDDRYAYGVKIYGEGTWEPLYYMRPKWQVAPETNPRINGVFDSKGTSLVINDGEYRVVISMRSWTTYLAVLDSLTVPAGTFHNVLRTRVKERTIQKVTSASDTLDVLGRQTFESTSDSWAAEGIGTIRTAGGSGSDAFERVLIEATVNGVSYPLGKDDAGGARLAGPFNESRGAVEEVNFAVRLPESILAICNFPLHR